MISVNGEAAPICGEMVERKGELGIGVDELGNGATVIDAGIEALGGLSAGKLYTEACLGGLAEVNFTKDKRLRVHLIVDRPAIACMASQYAGWRISVGDYFAMGSGPARALARVENLYDDLDYGDDSDSAVIALETREMPSVEVADFVAEKCGIEPRDLRILVAPTASIVGSVQISSRVVETGVHKLHELGFDVKRIISASGSAPVAPVAKDDLTAMGMTNDCSLYGGRTIYFVDAEDSEIGEVIEEMPSSSSEDYGSPFIEVFEKYDRDFYKIDARLFSPAEVTINNVRTGRVFSSGSINEEVLQKSLEGSS
ncbi:N(5),N(10)-methenyltetrahydromethanopterin cyclohydrolase [candidate division MSBL1 archaeon SCGC-AAA261F19]|uniref:Methenyltetrahydromethanopterin cyclohydrolase n=1 Tax=candidate division MSBL1 archaeon SCGC-AAA261F19 TaxID=1698275 RepID=A0A133V9B2_9EURY|nr:N(5),N(10)-methenyltetrahydromethanopterin cyclohydrolase [candidate division MSBL1 archaeon SCGC-AAA261F19]